ncbi:sulfatase-like hydrolase/transferase [Mesorhizobium koreense]|uniref:sulfatase-like hydrolase/transferase n=1 Tax=Mesorhizobium koreense TaxID=3074855 RepID=UPI00287BC8D9|nr:sulfatase-like hydrolase/transferase [Mesorhizobium sp. WR6]
MALGSALKDRSLRIEILHVFALVGVAVAQPVYSTLADGPEFFVANHAAGLQIIALVLALSIGLPLLIAVAEIGLRSMSRRLQRSVHLFVVWILLTFLALQVINRFFEKSAVAPIAVSIAAATVCTALYARSVVVKQLLTFLSIGALLFPLNFLIISPASKLILPGQSIANTGVDASRAKTPIVMVIFDEFNPTALLNKDGQIDSVRYPHFAQLAANAWWYPRATSTYPQTQFAVPAILSGELPDPAKQFPSYHDHPNNLFTMLGGSYALNVKESITSLCPDTLCTGKERAFSEITFASDIFIVYCHAIIPKVLHGRFLPSLRNGWNNFGSVASTPSEGAEAELIEAFNDQSGSSRMSKFSQFIGSIDGHDKTLNFMHILLPHQPYQFYPDGTYYERVADFGMDKTAWSSDQHFVDFAYKRYLMQVGYVDRMIGELIKRLKSINAYDRSMIIITADHGREFKTNTEDRILNYKDVDLLHVPLLIKLPNQERGEINKNLVSNIDIVPTIADVLGIDLNWKFDGQSVFSENYKESENLNIVFRSKEFNIDRNSIVSLPLLGWQTQTFGSGTSLSDLPVNGPYASMIGKDIESLDVVKAPKEQEARLTQNFSMLADIDPASDFRPWLVSSEVANLGDDGQPWIALALNGKIVTLSQVYKDKNGSDRILALFPPGSIAAGANALSAFQVSGSEAVLKLRPISTGLGTYKLERRGAVDILTSSQGNEYPIVTNKVFGSVDRVSVNGSAIELAGWSGDTDLLVPAEHVVVFVDGKFVCAIDPDTDRPDVAEYFKSSAMAKGGFSTGCPFRGSPQQLSSLRVFGITPSGATGELQLSKASGTPQQ